MSTAVKISDSEMLVLRKVAALQSRSLAGQAEHWLRLGRAFEANPIYGYAKVEQALQALGSLDDLNTVEQELYFEKLADSNWMPSATEDAYFTALRLRGGSVGMDDVGRIVVDHAPEEHAP